EALGIGAAGVEVSDANAIVEPEAGISIARLTVSELRDVVAHVEWEMPRHDAGGGLAQGKVAGVPAKLSTGEPALLVVQTCYVDALRPRLRWCPQPARPPRACSRSRGTRRARPTTSSSSVAAATVCRRPTTSRPATGSRTSPSWRPTTSPRV